MYRTELKTYIRSGKYIRSILLISLRFIKKENTLKITADKNVPQAFVSLRIFIYSRLRLSRVARLVMSEKDSWFCPITVCISVQSNPFGVLIEYNSDESTML